MFETFVSSRIRRTLLEYILSHPIGRFYLRGLAKELSLAVSPLRRELLRMERLGVLKAYDEANIRFYVVDQTNPQFAQLKQAAVSLTLQPEGGAPPSLSGAPALSRSEPAQAAQESEPVEPHPSHPAAGGEAHGRVADSSALSHRNVGHIREARKPRVSLGIVVGALCVGVLIVGVFSVSMYVAVSTSKSRMSGIESHSIQASGEMHSARWRVVPGGVGGFGSGTARGDERLR